VASLDGGPAEAVPFDPSAAGFPDGGLDAPDSPPPEGFLEVVREVEAPPEEVLGGRVLVVEVLEGETGGPVAEARTSTLEKELDAARTAAGQSERLRTARTRPPRPDRRWPRSLPSRPDS